MVANATRSSASLRRAIISAAQAVAKPDQPRLLLHKRAQHRARDATFFVASVFSALPRAGQEAAPVFGEQSHRSSRRAASQAAIEPPPLGILGEPLRQAPAAASRPAASWRRRRRPAPPSPPAPARVGAECPIDGGEHSIEVALERAPGRATAACAGPAAPPASRQRASVSVTARICSARPSGVPGSLPARRRLGTASCISSAAVRSSMVSKCGATPASSGNRRSRRRTARGWS